MRVYKSMITAALKANDYDLSFEQYVMLMILSLEKEPTQQDLANQLQKDKSMIFRQMTVLINKQYVDRKPDKNDKRMKKLHLTAKGSETVMQLKTIAQQVENQLLFGINPSALNTFMDILGKIHLNGGLNDEFCCQEDTSQN